MAGIQSFAETVPVETIVDLTPAASTSWQPLWAPWSAGNGRLDAITIKSTAAADHVVTIGEYSASGSPSASKPIASVSIPAGAGNGTVALADIIAAVAPAALAGLVVSLMVSLSIKLEVVLDTSEHLYVRCVGAEL